MSFGHDRSRRQGRRPPFRAPKKRILIVCEGENTERQYLEGFAKYHRDTLVDVKVADEHGVPMTVVRDAKRLKKEAANAARREGDRNLKFDAVWCVFDRDDHPHVPEALTMAANNNMEVALSNPCFELWLLLHLKDSPEMLHRHAALSMLKKLVADYDKSVNYTDYHAGYEQAVKRAKRLDELAKVANEPGMNPTTGVYRLTIVIAPPPEEKQPRKR